MGNSPCNFASTVLSSSGKPTLVISASDANAASTVSITVNSTAAVVVTFGGTKMSDGSPSAPISLTSSSPALNLAAGNGTKLDGITIDASASGASCLVIESFF